MMQQLSCTKNSPRVTARDGVTTHSLVCRSVAFRKAIDQCTRLASDYDATILLEGESGTGKTSLARWIHQVSPRHSRPFATVLLSALDDTLAGSELFGHVSGAFTDAQRTRKGRFVTANGGSLFLDEIGKTSLAVQQKLLHAVEYHEFHPIGSDRQTTVDVRLIAATNIPLAQAVDAGTFLPDLYARMMSFRVRIPPLRERRADIPELVQGIVAARAPQHAYTKPPSVHADLMNALTHAEWKFNIRQLADSLHRIMIDAAGANELTLDHCLDTDLHLPRFDEERRPSAAQIDDALQATRKNVAKAARLLGCSRSTLYRHRAPSTAS